MQSAIISADQQYRYALSRPSDSLSDYTPPILFVMLNPSTADADIDDPTIRRCRSFAQTWGANGIRVGNLFALRSTDPKLLLKHPDPVGPENDWHLARLASECRDVVCAWGSHPMAAGRAQDVLNLLCDAGARLWCLGTNKDRSPKHPLYIPSTQPLVDFSRFA